MAAAYHVPYLGRIPLDPCLGAAAESGRSIFDNATGTLAVCFLPCTQACCSSMLGAVCYGDACLSVRGQMSAVLRS